MEPGEILQLANYEEYIDSYLTPADIRYIGNIRYARMIVELGYRSLREIYTPEQFLINKQSAQEILFPTKIAATLYSTKCLSSDPVLRALAVREKPNFQRVLIVSCLEFWS